MKIYFNKLRVYFKSSKKVPLLAGYDLVTLIKHVFPLTFSMGAVKFSLAGQGLGSWCLGTVQYCVPPSGDNNQSTKRRRFCRDDEAVCCTDYTEEVRVIQEKKFTT